jgi:uncharacterized coiled-coil protein SlyX
MKKKYANNPRAAEARIYELSRKISEMRDEVQELSDVLRDSKESFEWTLSGLDAAKKVSDPFVLPDWK